MTSANVFNLNSVKQGQVLNAVLHKAAIAAGITCSRAGAQPPRAHELVDAMEK